MLSCGGKLSTGTQVSCKEAYGKFFARSPEGPRGGNCSAAARRRPRDFSSVPLSEPYGEGLRATPLLDSCTLTGLLVTLK